MFVVEFEQIYLILSRVEGSWLKFSLLIIGTRIIKSIWGPEKRIFPLLLKPLE